jgi:dienelactone hydrolase
VVSELLNFEKQGGLGKGSSAPKVLEISYAGPNGPVKADLFLPQGEGKRSGILLNHGVIDTGKEDPRLKRFAEILCRSGFVVFIPDFKGMRSFRIAPSDIDEVQAAFEHFISLKNYVLPHSCGLFGFSYGAGPTILAACRPAMRSQVRFVISFGGYYDLKNVLSFIGTGQFEFEGQRYFRQPQEYGKWVFLANNLNRIVSPEDRAILQKILQVKLRDEKAPIDQFLPLLGKEGKNILALLSHTDPSQTENLIQKLPPGLQAYIETLSVGPVMNQLKADLILAHGKDDDMIPFTETLRLARAVSDPRRVYLQILRSYSHVDPERQAWTVKNLINFYLPEGWKLFGLVNQLMKYRQGLS